jgi:hypothetical protein
MTVLIGIENIRPRLGGKTLATIMKWKVEYSSLPIQKLKGQWVAESSALDEWFAYFATDRLFVLEERFEREKRLVMASTIKESEVSAEIRPIRNAKKKRAISRKASKKPVKRKVPAKMTKKA